MEIEDDDFYDDMYESVDDTSWKVRRASIHLINSLLQN